MTRFLTILAVGLVLWTPVKLHALSPMVQFLDLVAGEGENGFENGPFYSAQFDHPLGLALNADGSILYVADQQNNRIRAILLDHDNMVETLAGTGEAGRKDGPISMATFNVPSALCFLPADRIVVFDKGNGLLRLIDLPTKTVSTLEEEPVVGSPAEKNLAPQKLNSIWNLAYDPKDQRLYFSQPYHGTLQYFDFKAQRIETVLKDDPRIPQPKALFISSGKLFMADQILPSIYEAQLSDLVSISPPVHAPTPQATPGKPVSQMGAIPVSLRAVGQAHKVVALAGAEDSLYAYQRDPKEPMIRVFPDSKPLTFESVWGTHLVNPAPGDVVPFFHWIIATDEAESFIADPRSKGRFFISNPFHSIIGSFRDLRQNDFPPSQGEIYVNKGLFHDFEYPVAKPPKTFRILLVGRCYLYWEGSGSFFEKGGKIIETQDYMLSVAKRTELLLNTEAALNDLPYHFEVFNGAMHHGANCVDHWAEYVVPPIVQKYDIDLVLMLHDEGFNFLDPYFLAPLTSEGIPADEMDSEFMLKPNDEKVKSDPLVNFIKLCRSKKFLDENSKTDWSFDYDAIISDQQTRGPFMDIAKRPLDLLRTKIAKIRNNNGQSPKLEVWYCPTNVFPVKKIRDFYKDLCQKAELPYIDLTDDFTVVGMAYWPYKLDPVAGGHYTTDGMGFIAQILVNELLKNHKVPEKTQP